MSQAAQAAQRIVGRCRELAQVSDVPGQTTRTFLSSATHDAHALVGGWMRQAGLRVWTDAIGNLRGVTGSEDLPRLVIGSHLDTVIDAGAFDGPLGVVMGIELANAPNSEGMPFAIEVIGFSDEEGVRFARPFLGSLAVVGELNQQMLELRDAAGFTITQAAEEFGLNMAQLSSARLAPSTLGYLEFHIEQGPVLEEAREAVAVVHAIAGQTRIQVSFQGHANHAGTTPMGRLRRDAVAAAAEWIAEVERYAVQCEGLIATVGKVEVPGGAANVIAGHCLATLDVRHPQDLVRRRAAEHMIRAAERAGETRGVEVECRTMLEQAAVPMDEVLTERLTAACVKLTGKSVRRMTSGAGHDAMIVASKIPTAMLFLRSPGGLSHHPDETVMESDVAAAYGAGLEFLRMLRDDKAMLDRLISRASRFVHGAPHA